MPAREQGRTHISEATLTIEKRILLHLMSHHSKRDDYEVPIGMSQEGIGKIFGVRQSSISRVINKMLREDLVGERAAYVSGSKQRRKVYFLTHKGYQYALDARKALEGMIVTLLIDNEPRDVELRNVNDHLSSPLDLLDIVRNLGPRGELDVSTIVKMAPREGKAPVIFGDPIPKGRMFVGRARELRTLERFLASSTLKLACIHGVAGIGKTALVARMLEDVTGRDVFYHRAREWSTLNTLLASLGAFLSRTGRRRLASMARKETANSAAVDLKEALSILEAEVRDLDALLIFDDFHQAPEAMLPFFQELVDMLPRTRAQAIVLTRYMRPFYDRRQVVVRGVVKELRLGGLSKADCRAILRDKDLDSATIDKVFKATGGHPLSLELIGTLGALHEVDKYVFEEIYSMLTASEKKVLQLASIMRYPVPVDLILQAGTEEIVGELVRKALLSEVGDAYEIQDLLREFFRTRTSPKVLKASHALALAHYKGQEGPFAVLETAHHMFNSGERGGAIDLLLMRSDQLVQEGLADAMVALIDGFGGDIPRERYKDAHTLREKAANVWGTWDNYLEYVMAYLLFERLLGYPIKEPSMALRTSFLGRSAEDTEKALVELEDSLQVLERIGDGHGLAHTVYNIAWVRWIRGEHSRARKEARRLLGMAIDNDLRGRATMLLCGIELEAGRMQESLSAVSDVRKACAKARSEEGLVQAQAFEAGVEVLDMLRQRGRKGGGRLPARVSKTLSSALATAKANHLRRATAYASLRKAQASLASDDTGGAERAATEAEGLFDRLHDITGKALAQATCALAIATDPGASNRTAEAIDTLKAAIGDLKRACLDRLTAALHLHLEKIYSAAGDTFGADSARKEAERLGVVPRRS